MITLSSANCIFKYLQISEVYLAFNLKNLLQILVILKLEEFVDSNSLTLLVENDLNLSLEQISEIVSRYPVNFATCNRFGY